MTSFITNNTDTKLFKLCKICNNNLSISKYYKDNAKKDGLKCECIDCYNTKRNIKCRENLHRYYNYEPVQRPYCKICDHNFLPGNYDKHLISANHKNKIKQLEKNKNNQQKNNILEPISSR